MEKLIELLNEYEIERERKFEGFKQDRMPYYERSNKELGDGTITYLWLGKEDYKGEELYGDSANAVLISKSYGFIKWLVENDKIDIKALVVKGEMRSGWDFDNKKGDEETGEESWNKYYSELCLMLLAIQENPIDFLCSILK